jgi:hypothetical protein
MAQQQKGDGECSDSELRPKRDLHSSRGGRGGNVTHRRGL